MQLCNYLLFDSINELSNRLSIDVHSSVDNGCCFVLSSSLSIIVLVQKYGICELELRLARELVCSKMRLDKNWTRPAIFLSNFFKYFASTMKKAFHRRR